MKWLSSLDEFLYEVMSWLLFFPLTLWRATIRPLTMMEYADRQLALPDEEQYAAALSPPLFLAIALLLAQGISRGLGQSDAIVADQHGLGAFIDDDAKALVLRVIVFAAFALFAAARLTRLAKQPLDRRSLRLPFYAQCYPTGVCALGLSLGVDLMSATIASVRFAALALIGASICHYCVLEARWFAVKLGIGYVRASGAVAVTLLEGFALLLFTGFLFTR